MINVNQHPFENQKIITADLYKGSIIEKAYGGGDEGLISAEIIRVQLNNKLEKGIIDQQLYDKAIEQLDGILEKGGEGSKGGKIIGHTKSGKPIYESHVKSAIKSHFKGSRDHNFYEDEGKRYVVFNQSAKHRDDDVFHEKITHKESGTKLHYLTSQDYDDGSISHTYEIEHTENSKDKKLKKAYDILGIKYTESQDKLEKASKGEGSRGGHIIGHTKSGKPVYAAKKASENKDFTAQDHKDASDLHSKQSSDHRAKVVHPHNTALADHHHQVSNAHQQEAAKQIQKEHESGLSGDEKKIISDQKKKQIEHHKDGEDFHGSLLNDFYKKHGTDESKWSSHMKEAHSQWKDKMFHHKSEKERLEKE